MCHYRYFRYNNLDTFCIPEYYCDGLTTSDRLLVKQPLRYLALKGITNVGIEASSHALDQTRLNNVKANCIGVTSFSRDHLEYQQTMHQFFNAKLKVFTKNATDNTVVVIK